MEEIKKEAERLKEELEKRGVNVEAIYLFGSYARGDFVSWSDVDLIVVSNAFKDIPFIERTALIYKILDIEASVVPLTEEELERKAKESVVLKDASKYWIRIV